LRPLEPERSQAHPNVLEFQRPGWPNPASSGQPEPPFEVPDLIAGIREALDAIKELDVRRARDLLAALIRTEE
jgi:hypothetical protein